MVLKPAKIAALGGDGQIRDSGTVSDVTWEHSERLHGASHCSLSDSLLMQSQKQLLPVVTVQRPACVPEAELCLWKENMPSNLLHLHLEMQEFP